MMIDLSILHSYQSLFEALVDGLHIKKSFLKKHQIPKKKLQNKVKAREVLQIPIDLINRNIINANYDGPEVDFLFQDCNFLVLSKPHSIHSHPLSYSESNNCLSYLRSRGFSQDLEVNQQSWDRGLLHRLDFETSGVLIYVRNQNLHTYLRENFSSITRKKIYLMIVEGDYPFSGLITHTLTPSLRAGKKMKESAPGERSDQDSKEKFIAKLRVKKLQFSSKNNLSLLAVDLLTGIRHQIRAQLSLQGFPILGDHLYGGREDQRLFLHSFQYNLVCMDSIHSLKHTFTFRDDYPYAFDQYFQMRSYTQQNLF